MAVDPVQNALARKDPDELKFIKLLMSRSRTTGAEVERRRIELANASLTLDSLTAAILRDAELPEEKQMSPEKMQRLLTVASVLGMSSIVKGQELIVDCITVRERVKIKGGKYGHRRFTLGELVQYLVAAIGEEETDDSDGTGVLGAIEQGLEMLNDVGIALNAFKDERGVVKHDKYFFKEEPGAAKPEVEVDENEAVEEGTGSENSAEDILKKVKK